MLPSSKKKTASAVKSTGKAPAATKSADKPVAKKGFPARKPGTAAKPKRKVLTFRAPSDFKAAFIDLKFQTSADGLLSPNFKMERIKGKWDNPDAKRFDMLEYDARTVAAILARIQGRLFHSNPARRLQPNTWYRIILRVGKNAATDALRAGVKGVGRYEVVKDKKKIHWLEAAEKGTVLPQAEIDALPEAKREKAQAIRNTEVERRRIRSVARFLAPAFMAVQLPPSGRRPKKDADEE